MILPDADATMSIWPKLAQATARQKSTMSVAPIARPIGDGGVSTISRAAGRKASSFLVRRFRPVKNPFVVSMNFIGSTLQTIKRCISPTRPDQFIMRPVLDQAATIDGHDAIRRPH